MSNLSSSDGTLQKCCANYYAMLKHSREKLADAVGKSKMRQRINDLEDQLKTIEEREGLAYVANLRSQKRLTDKNKVLKNEVRELRFAKRRRDEEDENRARRQREDYEHKQAAKRRRRTMEQELAADDSA